MQQAIVTLDTCQFINVTVILQFDTDALDMMTFNFVRNEGSVNEQWNNPRNIVLVAT